MEYGHICFSYSKDKWLAKAISFLTKSQWSHCFITIPGILEKEMVIEADGKEISTILFDIGYRNNKNQKYEVYKFKIPQKNIDESIRTILNLLETPYGLWEYPWFIWRIVLKLFGKDIRKQDNWIRKGTVCSDLVRNYIELSGHENLFLDFGKDSANVQDVYEIVKQNPQLFEIVEKKD